MHFCTIFVFNFVMHFRIQYNIFCIFGIMQGIGFMEFRGEPTSFLKSTVSVLSTHYPQRSFKIIILNAPSYFNAAFNIIKSMLNENTRAKISVILATEMATEMLKVC